MNEKNTETILEALAERIRDMKTDIYLKDAEIERLRERIADLEVKLGERKDDKN